MKKGDSMDSYNKVEYLEKKAKELRKTIIEMIYHAQSGHPGGSLSIADIVAALYFDELNIDPKNPKWEDRDRVILSKGHVCPAIYGALAMKEYFPYEEIYTLRKINSRLQGHPDMKKTPGLDMTTGSLGQGLSVGVGMAIAAKFDKKPYRTFVILGDGELQEGQVWEAAMSAAKYKLDNLIAFVDVNNLQVDGCCDDIMSVKPIVPKWKDFGWEVFEIDGHNMEVILKTLEGIKNVKGKPICIVMNTIKGKGVSYMEGVCKWHGQAPNTEEYNIAIEEIMR